MKNGTMTDIEKNEEAHGQWEFAVIRLALLAETGATMERIQEAVKEERTAYQHWMKVSRKVTS